jgi:hypothetical protein
MEPSKKQETVVVQDYPQKMGHVQAQPHTHFRLKQKSDRQQLLHTIEGASTMGPIVASYDYGRKYDTDIIIRKKGESNSTKPIGKIHLLLFDRRDRYNHEKYYIKLHFFQFANDTLFDSVKQAVTTFFNSLPQSTESYLGNRTPKNSRNNKNSTRKNPASATKFDMISKSENSVTSQ